MAAPVASQPAPAPAQPAAPPVIILTQIGDQVIQMQMSPETQAKADKLHQDLLRYPPFGQMILDSGLDVAQGISSFSAKLSPSHVLELDATARATGEKASFSIAQLTQDGRVAHYVDERVTAAAFFLLNPNAPNATPPDFDANPAAPAQQQQQPAPATPPPGQQSVPPVQQPLAPGQQQQVPAPAPLQHRMQPDAPQNQDQLLRTFTDLFTQFSQTQIAVAAQHTLQIQALANALAGRCQHFPIAPPAIPQAPAPQPPQPLAPPAPQRPPLSPFQQRILDMFRGLPQANQQQGNAAIARLQPAELEQIIQMPEAQVQALRPVQLMLAQMLRMGAALNHLYPQQAPAQVPQPAPAAAPQETPLQIYQRVMLRRFQRLPLANQQAVLAQFDALPQDQRDRLLQMDNRNVVQVQGRAGQDLAMSLIGAAVYRAQIQPAVPAGPQPLAQHMVDALDALNGQAGLAELQQALLARLQQIVNVDMNAAIASLGQADQLPAAQQQQIRAALAQVVSTAPVALRQALRILLAGPNEQIAQHFLGVMTGTPHTALRILTHRNTLQARQNYLLLMAGAEALRQEEAAVIRVPDAGGNRHPFLLRGVIGMAAVALLIYTIWTRFTSTT